MKVWSKILIVLFALLLDVLLQSELSVYLFSGLLILALGIPHGASDHVIHNVLQGAGIKSKTSLLFLLQYFSLIFFYLGLWLLIPGISLILFLAISAYHFGETQFFNWKNESSLKPIMAFVWGSLVLTMLLFVNIRQVTEWLLPLTGFPNIYIWFAENGLVLLISQFLIFTALLLTIDRARIEKELIELAVLSALFINTNVIFGFSIFFAFWHSRDAIFAQLSGLKKVQKEFSMKGLIKMLIPYSVISIVGLVILTLASTYIDIQISWVIVFFVFVALLTLPHSILMSLFYKKVKLS